jgi:hypothetical protein
VEETMLKQGLAVLAPAALIVAATACGGEPSSTTSAYEQDHGRWSPGWGWKDGRWIIGGTVQYTCVTDTDCIGPLGAGVAVCSFDPAVAIGFCIAANW